MPAGRLSWAQAPVLLNSAIPLCSPLLRQVSVSKYELIFHNLVFQHVPASLPIVLPCYQLDFLLKWGEQQEQGAENPFLTQMLILREMSVSAGDVGIAAAAEILSEI